MSDDAETMKLLYRRFNARDIDGVLALVHADVTWANGMDGGYVHGHEGVRDYWTRQWTTIDPRVEPLDISVVAAGEIVVEVRQIVRDFAGNVRSDKMVGHLFRLDGGLVRQFDIRSARPRRAGTDQ